MSDERPMRGRRVVPLPGAKPGPVAPILPEQVAAPLPEQVAAPLPEPIAAALPEPLAAALPEPLAAALPEPLAAPLPEPVAVLAAPVAVLPAPESLPRQAWQQAQKQDGADKLLAACQTTLASIGKLQTAIASDVTAMAIEMTGLARSNLTAAGDGAIALLAARSLADAVEIQFGLARRSFAAMVGGSTRLAELGLRLASDTAKPMLGPFAAAEPRPAPLRPWTI